MFGNSWFWTGSSIRQAALRCSNVMVLTSEVGRGHPPGRHSRLGFRWNTSHRSDTCQQEAHILVNYTVRHQHSQSQRGHEEAAANQGRTGQGVDTQEEAEGKVGRRRQPIVMQGFCVGGCFDFARKFRSGWLVTPKQANADITSVKKKRRERGGEGKGREKGEGGRWGGEVKMNIKKKKKREINRYKSDGDDGGKRGRRGGEHGRKKMWTTTNRGQRAKAKQRLASDVQW